VGQVFRRNQRSRSQAARAVRWLRCDGDRDQADAVEETVSPASTSPDIRHRHATHRPGRCSMGLRVQHHRAVARPARRRLRLRSQAKRMLARLASFASSGFQRLCSRSGQPCWRTGCSDPHPDVRLHPEARRRSASRSLAPRAAHERYGQSRRTDQVQTAITRATTSFVPQPIVSSPDTRARSRNWRIGNPVPT
jgi:hypothetical protein